LASLILAAATGPHPVTEFPQIFVAHPEDAGKRIDQFLVAELPQTSRARVQQLIS
jgi:hypothetical protein